MSPGHDEWCYADTVTLSVTHNHQENTGQEIADRKVNFVQQKTSTLCKNELIHILAQNKFPKDHKIIHAF